MNEVKRKRRKQNSHNDALVQDSSRRVL